MRMICIKVMNITSEHTFCYTVLLYCWLLPMKRKHAYILQNEGETRKEM